MTLGKDAPRRSLAAYNPDTEQRAVTEKSASRWQLEAVRVDWHLFAEGSGNIALIKATADNDASAAVASVVHGYARHSLYIRHSSALYHSR